MKILLQIGLAVVLFGALGGCVYGPGYARGGGYYYDGGPRYDYSPGYYGYEYAPRYYGYGYAYPSVSISGAKAHPANGVKGALTSGRRRVPHTQDHEG